LVAPTFSLTGQKINTAGQSTSQQPAYLLRALNTSTLITEHLKEKTTKKSFFAVAALAVCNMAALGADLNPTVGGAAMYPTKTIVENALNSPIHSTLVAAVKAAGLVDTLNSPGPFTVFAPTDDAFAKLPAGTVDTLVKPESKKA
jgi:uncharacterized surface protein with fasciclin (FAS1) repeats